MSFSNENALKPPKLEMKLQTARALLFQAMEAGDRGLNLGTALSIGTKW